jgi:hypothetical protein
VWFLDASALTVQVRKSWTLVTPKLEENGVKFFLKVFEVRARC